MLRAKNEELIETKGQFEAHKVFATGKESTQLATTNQWMDMMKSYRDLLAGSQEDSAKKEKQLNKLRQEFDSVQKKVIELVKQKERASVQGNIYNDQLHEKRVELAACKRQLDKCWWC